MYLHKSKDWPAFFWDNDTLVPYVSKVRDLQGRLIGRMDGMQLYSAQGGVGSIR